MIFKDRPDRRQRGENAERSAEVHLHAQGLQAVERNYRCRMGEIDLVMKHADTLVFVEVRYRKHAGYGSAVESVTAAKQRKLRLAAQHYIQAHRIGESCPQRFDVVGVSPTGIEWIENAF